MIIKDPPHSLIRAARRLNPAVELEVDILAVSAAAGASAPEDWATATLTDTVSDDRGVVRLSETGSPVEMFSSGGTLGVDNTDKYNFVDGSNPNVIETLWLDFWPDPGVVGPHGFTLDSFRFGFRKKDNGISFGQSIMGEASTPRLISNKGNLVIRFARLDENWNRDELCAPMVIPADKLPDNLNAECVVDIRNGSVTRAEVC